MQPTRVYLHTDSLRHHFAHRPSFDIFACVSLAWDRGFDGVTISVDGQGFRHLCGTDSGHFARVRDALDAHGLNVELDAGVTHPQHLRLLLEVAATLGAERLRTRTHHKGSLQEITQRTAQDLATAAERAALTGVRIVLGERGELRGEALAELVQRLDSEHVRAAFDYGTAQILGDDPLAALETLRPFVEAVSVRDHVLVRDTGELHVQGVAVGDGSLPIAALTWRLYETGFRHFSFENAWSRVEALPRARLESAEAGVGGVREVHPLIDGARLDPESAIEGERAALQRGWQWFAGLLATIEDDERLQSAQRNARSV